MAFRGFGDDALKVKADKREAALKAAQIAASERASMRTASVQMAGLQENARQADMANQRAGEQMAGLQENARQADMTNQRAGEQMRKADLGVKMEELSRRERQIQLNESTAAKLDAEWKQQQAVQEELSNEAKSIELAILRFTVENPDKHVPMGYINAFNNANGVAYGDPGSLTQAFGVPDPQTGARLGTGTVKIGQDGKPIQSILDPAIILPQLRKSMAPDKWEDLAQRLLGANKSKGSDRVTAATMREMQQHKLEFAKSDPASLVKTLAEQEDILRMTKPTKAGTGKAADPANQENFDRVGRIKTNVLKELEAQTGGGEEVAPASKLSPEQRAFMATPGAGAGQSTGIDKQALVEQARRDAKGDKAKAFELYNAALAKAKQAEVAKRRAGGDETTADKAAGGAAPTPAAAEKAEAAPEAKNLAASQALRRQNATKSTPEVATEEKDVRAKFFPPVRRSDEPLGDYNQKFEQWVNDNPWYRALQEAITPRTEESSLLPPVRKANETVGAHNARFERWRKDNPLMRFFEGLKSEPGSKPGEK